MVPFHLPRLIVINSAWLKYDIFFSAIRWHSMSIKGQFSLVFGPEKDHSDALERSCAMNLEDQFQAPYCHGVSMSPYTIT